MKKILLFIVALVATLSMNAQTTEIHNETGKVASYLGADVTVKFGVDGSEPTIEVYKGDVWQKTYKGSEYKVVSTPVEETFKAVYDTNGGVLTFYYDAVDHSGKGITVYQDGTANYLFDDSKISDEKWGYNGVRKDVSKVVIHESVKKYSSLTSTAYMFMDMENATGISGAEYLDVANVKDMSDMFNRYGFSSKDFNTVPDVSKWNTGNVKKMSNMFYQYGCGSTVLNTVPDISKWNTGNVTNMEYMFSYYGGIFPSNLSCVLDLSRWNLTKLTSAYGVFDNFKPKTFEVTIPGKTGEKANDASHWYYGDGSKSITPPEGKSFTMFGTGSAAVKAGAGVSGNKVKWIQLWEGGPKFAEFNVGVTDGEAKSYGGYYAWGGSQDKVDDHNTGSSALSGDSDTATKLWGNNWRMPTSEEFEALLSNNCDFKWTKNYNGTGIAGRIFTGKGDYAANSIFLPAAGDCDGDQGSYGNYWSSTPDDSDCAYFLLFESGSSYWRVGFRLRRNGYSVRAVVRDPVAVTGVSLNKTTLELGVGASETLTPTFIPADADNKNVSWASSDESVATVDANGKVTAVAIGEATITVTTEDGNKTATCKLAVFPAASVGTIKAKIGEKDVDVKWVQLWAGGPKFAEYNVGATSATEYGEYYAWGGSQNKVDDHNTGSSALSGDSDTATKLWGNNWRMPTSEEFYALLSNCDVKWTVNYNGTGIAGRIFTGKGDYAANSIFLPAAGKGESQEGSNGYYWSSTPEGDKAAYALGFNSNTQRVFNTSRSTIYSVRAVVNEPTTGTAKATIGGVDKEVKWIQLWEGGPKFAEYNVGVTDSKAESYGGYYCWGKATDKDSQGAYKDGTSALTSTDDTATNLWGSNWRMPTQTELQGLIENCDVAWTTVGGKNGRKFTGRGDYASNSVFLPAAGYFLKGKVGDQGVYGDYWSSTPTGSKAYNLRFGSGSSPYVVGDGRDCGYSVRSVLAKE